MNARARLVRVVLACLVVLFASHVAPGYVRLHAAQPPAVAQPPGGGFDFPDEDEDVPTWGDDLRAQAVDLALVGGFLVLAFVSFFRKSVALKYVTLVAAVGFLGVSKSLLISIVNVFGLVGGNLPTFRPNLAWYLLAGVTVVSTTR